MIVAAGVIGLLFSLYQFWKVASIKLTVSGAAVNDSAKLLGGESSHRLIEIYNAIREGADSFLMAEYKICAIFIVIFGAIVLVLCSYVNLPGQTWDWQRGGLTALAFAIGACTSIVSGYLGMKVAVFSNARTTVSAMDTEHPWKKSFNCAFQAGGVMGFSLCALALLVLFFLICAYCKVFDIMDRTAAPILFECIAGYGLGGSSIALFGRVGGGIYTKAADVGADLAGKVVENIPEDDPRNPATIADNVGDNVGDVAGMGSDLFGSFAEATCAALVVSTSLTTGSDTGLSWGAYMFPLLISGLGIFVCMLCSFLATDLWPVKCEADVEKMLKVQLLSTTVIMTIFLYLIAIYWLPESFTVESAVLYAYENAETGTFTMEHFELKGSPLLAWGCVCSGLWAGCAIGFLTEYFTSHSYTPVREVAQSCETGAATNIIYGLALGYKSAIIPVVLLAVVVYFSFAALDMYGVSLAALGMLSTLATCLSIDVYGPICDTAGGIAEMAELPEHVREKTDALDAAGNTTAAIGKGFAIGSACLVGLALFGAFITRSALTMQQISIVSPVIFAFLLVGAMIPFWFFAMTMKSVGEAANEMVKEVARQFRTIPGLLEGTPGHAPPDHARCIEISTNASLREMILPGVLVMGSPLVTGIFFGSDAAAGLLAGAISSSIQMAISSSNTGGAWDNAKKYVEKGCVLVNGQVQGKGSDLHKAAVTGDTVGDPLKDTSGPALNIVMKLMAILSLVFSGFFKSINNGNGVLNLHRSYN